MECCLGFYRVQSGGERLTNFLIWSSMSAVLPSVHFSGLRTDTISVVWQLVCQTGSKTMPPVNCPSMDPWLLLLIAQRVQFPFPGGGGSHILAETNVEYLGNGYKERLVEYPVFDLRLLKRSLQKVASSAFGCLDTFSLTEFTINRMNGAKHRDWMLSRSSLRRAIITKELLQLVEVFAHIVGVWPLSEMSPFPHDPGNLYGSFFVLLHLAQVVPYMLRMTPGKILGDFSNMTPFPFLFGQ